jgi:predicted anti-sigma-YlaC factor YlaD
MAPHEEFLELCAAATAGELTSDERAKLTAHLAVCKECRDASTEFEVAATHAAAAVASEFDTQHSDEKPDDSWSVEKAEKALHHDLHSTDGLLKNVKTTFFRIIFRKFFSLFRDHSP